MVKAETVTRHRSWLFTLFFAHVNICRLFHLLWPCLLRCHLPSAPFPFFSLSSSSSTFFQHSHLFWPFPVSANMLQFLPDLRSNMALPISSPAHLVQSNIHLLPFTETVPITLSISSQPSFQPTLGAWMAWTCQPHPSGHWTCSSLSELVPLDFYCSSPSWFCSHLSSHLPGVLHRSPFSSSPHSLPAGLLQRFAHGFFFLSPSLWEPHPQTHHLY